MLGVIEKINIRRNMQKLIAPYAFNDAAKSSQP
jgi:hypothetical protein